jgi:CHAT domain-containing protein
MRLDPVRLLRQAAKRWKSLALVLILCVLPTCSRTTDDPLAQAAELIGSAAIAPRLSVASSFTACPEAAPAGGTIARRQCPALRPSERKRLAELTGDAESNASYSAVSHTMALVELVADDASGKALERSIRTLRQEAELADRPAPVFADLAAALIIRAERTQTPRDLLEAFETAEQALESDPRNLGALYNRALALDRFGLVDEVARDWAAYLAIDSTSGWADEARRRRTLALTLQPPLRPAADAPLGDYARFAAADPEQARELGMDELLSEWGEATEAGDAMRAADRLRHAAALGEALKRRPGGDASLADAVGAIRAAGPDSAATATLARAHREYGAGQAAFEALDFKAAEQRFTVAAVAPSLSPALAGWARVYHGTTLVQRDRWPEAELILREAATADSSRYPALIARALWTTGRTLGQGDRLDTALRDVAWSAELFSRSGERENEGSALNVLSGLHFVWGAPDSGYAALHRSLDRLRPYRTSLRLHNFLAWSAGPVSDDGLQRAALRLLDEDVGVAARTRSPVFAIEALLRRARHLAGRGAPAEASSDLDSARTLSRGIADERARRWVQAELRQTDAALSLNSNPGLATRMLDSVVGFFSRNPYRALPALVSAAEARLAAGDLEGASARLARAIGLLEDRRDSVRIEPRRAGVFDAARSVVDRIVLLELAQGRAGIALEHMDRARASLASAAGPMTDELHSASPLPGEVAVEYARIADTLLIWTVSQGRVEVSRTVLDTVRLARTLEWLERELQGGASAAAVRPALSLLHEWLVRPVEARLRPGTRLVVIVDGEIAAVPFAALFNARRERYVVQDHPLRFAVSLREAQRRPVAPPAPGVLLVADPAYDRRAHPLLEPLKLARQEVTTIAGGYPGATLLEGTSATRRGLMSALPRAGIVHFAGHAVFDDQRPERSYLVLAPEPAPNAVGRITAAELSQLDLRYVGLVVLSACRTVRSGRSRAGGFTGLSGALLAAGAGGAVGSTWQVEDRFTAALMAEFHRAYGPRRDGPAALRAAQLALLGSLDPELSSPAAWAGFRYAGR